MKKSFAIFVSLLGGTIWAATVLFSVGFVLWNFDMPSWGMPLRFFAVLVGLGLGIYFTKLIYSHIS